MRFLDWIENWYCMLFDTTHSKCLIWSSELIATLSLHEVFKGTEVLEQVWLDGVEKKVKGFG